MGASNTIKMCFIEYCMRFPSCMGVLRDRKERRRCKAEAKTSERKGRIAPGRRFHFSALSLSYQKAAWDYIHRSYNSVRHETHRIQGPAALSIASFSLSTVPILHVSDAPQPPSRTACTQPVKPSVEQQSIATIFKTKCATIS